jgi:diguanylate cyclase (GGDEF)-like protein
MQNDTRPLLNLDASVNPENYRMFRVINHVARLGFVVHTIFVPLFVVLQVYPLAAFNVLSSLASFAGYRINQKGNHSLAVTLLSCEVVLHTALAVYLVGWSAGFQNYLMAAIPFAVFNHQWRTRTMIVVTGGVLVLYCLLYAVAARLQPVPIEAWIVEGISYLNAIVVFAALGVTSYFFREASQETERHVEDLANTDPLTQIPNRRRLWELLELERLRSERSGRSFVIALADIDHFKRFNDSYGHHCGDAVLSHVATVMRASVRRTDTVGRWGGEEFLFILPETPLKGAMEVLEKVRRCVEEVPCRFGDQTYHVTVTFGAANFGRKQTLERCIREADDALYQGKEQGRNQVMSGPLLS